MIDFNGMSIYVGLFKAKRLWNRVHIKFLDSCLRVFWRVVLHMVLSNTINF